MCIPKLVGAYNKYMHMHSAAALATRGIIMYGYNRGVLGARTEGAFLESVLCLCVHNVHPLRYVTHICANTQLNCLCTSVDVHPKLADV